MIRTAFASLLAPLVLACAPAPRHDHEIAEGWRGAPEISSALVAPMNATGNIAEELEPGADRVIELLEQHLGEHGIAPESPELFRFRDFWTRSFEGVELDRKNPEVPPEVIATLIRKLRTHHEFDVLVVPILEFRNARINGLIIRWDGVRRKFEDEGMYRGVGSWQGTRPDLAMSLRVRIFDESGARVFDGVGGLDLLFKFGSTYDKVLVDEPLGDVDALAEGVRIALDPFIPFEP